MTGRYSITCARHGEAVASPAMARMLADTTDRRTAEVRAMVIARALACKTAVYRTDGARPERVTEFDGRVSKDSMAGGS